MYFPVSVKCSSD